MTVIYKTPPHMNEDLAPLLKLEKSIGHLWPRAFSWTMMANIENAIKGTCSEIELEQLKHLKTTALKCYPYEQGIFFSLTINRKLSVIVMLGKLHQLLPDDFTFTIANLDYSTCFTYTNVNTPTIRIFKVTRRS